MRWYSARRLRDIPTRSRSTSTAACRRSSSPSSRIKEQGVMVSIGSENPRLSGFAVIAAPYVGGSKPLGSLAIVGPVRMDYERVIPLVEYTARALSKILEH